MAEREEPRWLTAAPPSGPKGALEAYRHIEQLMAFYELNIDELQDQIHSRAFDLWERLDPADRESLGIAQKQLLVSRMNKLLSEKWTGGLRFLALLSHRISRDTRESDDMPSAADVSSAKRPAPSARASSPKRMQGERPIQVTEGALATSHGHRMTTPKYQTETGVELTSDGKSRRYNRLAEHPDRTAARLLYDEQGE
jgi:hypothetical protein